MFVLANRHGCATSPFGPSEKSRDVRKVRNAPHSGLCSFRSNHATVTAAKPRYLAIWPVARAFRRCQLSAKKHRISLPWSRAPPSIRAGLAETIKWTPKNNLSNSDKQFRANRYANFSVIYSFRAGYLTPAAGCGYRSVNQCARSAATAYSHATKLGASRPTSPSCRSYWGGSTSPSLLRIPN